MNILEAKAISKLYNRTQILKNVSISFHKEKITGISGLNGSGKTTLLNIFTGMETFEDGMVFVDFIEIKKINSMDIPIYRISTHKDNNLDLGSIELKKVNSYDLLQYGISRSFQEVSIFEQMTVLDNILVVLTPRKIKNSLFHDDKIDIERAEELLTKVGLIELKDQLGWQLSFSDKKLLDFCRLIAMNTEILIIDEIFIGMRKESVEKVIQILDELNKQNKTIIIADSDVDILKEFCDFIYILVDGAIFAKGEPEAEELQKAINHIYSGA